MAKSYSMDLRKRVITAYERGQGSLRKLAQRFDVSFSFVNQLWRRYEREGTMEPKPHGGGKPRRARGEEEELFLRASLERKNDLTLAELVQSFEVKFGKRMSVSTMHETLRRMNLTRKKKVSMTPNGRAKKWQKEP